MATIQKRADELKPGDVLPVKDGSVVLVGVRYVSADCVELMGCVMSGDRMNVETRNQREFTNTRIAVEVPDLTPAQQHAEELLELAKNVSAAAAGINPPTGSFAHIATALVSKIEPPEPPTLEEALTLLSGVTECRLDGHLGTKHNAALDLLYRARKAGVFK